MFTYKFFIENEMQFTAFSTPTDFTYIMLKATGKLKAFMDASTGLTGDSADFNLMLEVARMRKTSALANAAKSKVTTLN